MAFLFDGSPSAPDYSGANPGGPMLPLRGQTLRDLLAAIQQHRSQLDLAAHGGAGNGLLPHPGANFHPHSFGRPNPTPHPIGHLPGSDTLQPIGAEHPSYGVPQPHPFGLPGPGDTIGPVEPPSGGVPPFFGLRPHLPPHGPFGHLPAPPGHGPVLAARQALAGYA